MKDQALSFPEKFVLVLVALMLAAGLLLFYTNRDNFLYYVQEDGIVEWLTVTGLLAGCFASLSRFIRQFRRRHWWFLTVTIGLAILLFFAAGEEISWGQRILGIKSSEFFEKNNAQGETNFHNLIVSGVKLNKLIFTLLLGVAMGVYLLLIPLLHKQSIKIRSFLDRSGVPIARLYQIIAFALMAGVTVLIPDGKNAELLEGGAALIFFLIIQYPKNRNSLDNTQGR